MDTYASLWIPTLVAFLATAVALPFSMKFSRRIGLTAIDQQKPGKPILPTSAGLPVLVGFFLGSMAFVAISTFYTHTALDLPAVLAAVLTTVVITLIGFIDDIHIGKEKKTDVSGGEEFRIGLPQWAKPLLTFPAAIPLMAVAAGVTVVTMPFLGETDFGLWYPLVLVPLGVVFVSNAANMLAGLNGVEAGMGVIANLGLGLFCIANQRWEGAALALTTAGALAAFLRVNWTPAKLLPGDSLTYFAGGAYVSAVVVGNVEQFGAFLFLPWIVEFVLKARAGFKARSYGQLQPDGTIDSFHGNRIYSLTHVAMKLPKWLGGKKTATEAQAAALLLGLEAVLLAVASFVFA